MSHQTTLRTARPVYLIAYNSPLFAAHWSLFIPEFGSDTVGKVIHVVGDVRAGFKHEFKRNYDLSQDQRRFQRIVLPPVAAEHIVDVCGNGESSSDTTPHDDLERMALEVPAPGPSLRAATASASTKAISQSNCQHWISNYVNALVRRGVMDGEAPGKIQTAPRN